VVSIVEFKEYLERNPWLITVTALGFSTSRNSRPL
jgi:hypothetical protein